MTHKKLIAPIKDGDGAIIYFVHTDELFELLYSTHIQLGHFGRSKMEVELAKTYKNITKEFNHRCQVDLIDLQSKPLSIALFRDLFTN